MNLPNKINICEVDVRDGLQNEQTILSVDQKVELINDLVQAGYKVIEVGSFMHPKRVPSMANTDEVFKALTFVDGVEYRALVPNTRGVQRAIDCGCKKAKLNVSASKMHNIKNLGMTPAESVAGFKEAVDLGNANGVEMSGSISMPFASPWEAQIPIEDVIEIVEAYLEVGITEISLSDASGMASPKQVFETCIALKEKFPQVKWWLHFHNTRGLALANVIAGMEAGFTNYDSAFAGLGGCPFIPDAAGNLVSEDLLHMCDIMDVETGVDTRKIIEVGNKVTKWLGVENQSFVAKAGLNSDLIKE